MENDRANAIEAQMEELKQMHNVLLIEIQNLSTEKSSSIVPEPTQRTGTKRQRQEGTSNAERGRE